MDTLGEFILTQPIVGVTERSVITQKKAKRNVHNKRSRCSDTLGWVEIETGVKYRKLGKNEKGGY